MAKLRNPLVLLGIGSLLAALLPLVLPLARNFEYEYTSLLGYGALLGFSVLGFVSAKDSTPRLIESVGACLGVLLLAALPGALAFSLRLCPCSVSEFWFWWFVQSVPHLCLGLAVFWGLQVARKRGLSRGHCLLLLLILIALLSLHLAATLWFFPQKRITHLLSGFVHGAIYDTWIPLDAGVIWTRAAHTLVALALLGLSLRAKKSSLLAWTLPLLLAAAFCLVRGQSFPSQSHGIQALKVLLSEEKRGQNFVLHFQKPKTPEEERRLNDIFIAAGFHVNDLSRILMSYDRAVHIFLYPSEDTKKLWFGGGATDVTDVVTPSVHITSEPWPHSTLRHELVHAISSAFAYHGLGFHPNLAFTEGLAMALAPTEDELSLHEGAARLLESDRAPPLDHLFSPLFWTESGRRAYTLAGSFVSFLIDRYGALNVKLLYSGVDWSNVYREDFADTLTLWRNFLEASYPPRPAQKTAEAIFRYPGLFGDRCPHSKASLSKASPESFLRWRQPPAWLASRDYWPWRLSLDQEPGTVLAALHDRMRKLWSQDDASEAQKLIQDLEQKVQTPPRYLEDFDMMILATDLEISLGHWNEARERIAKLRSLLEAHELSDGLTRQIWSRALLLSESQQASAGWLALLRGQSTVVPDAPETRSSWIGRYLYLRNHSFSDADKDFLFAAWNSPVPEDAPLSFRVEWYKQLGLQWIRLTHWKWGSQALQKAADLATAAQKPALSLMSQEAFAREPRVH